MVGKQIKGTYGHFTQWQWSGVNLATAVQSPVTWCRSLTMSAMSLFCQV